MKTFLESQELWDLVEYGFVDLEDPDEEVEERLKEVKKRDAKALFLIQQAIHETIFSRIAAKEFQGSSKVMTVKLQTYHREFKMLSMKSNEPVQTYLSRVSSLVNQMKSYGEDISEKTIVAKVLRILTPNFEHIVAAIEEAHNLSNYSFDELMSSLQAHEDRLLRSHEKNEEKAFQLKGEMHENVATRSSGRSGICGRGQGRDDESKLFMTPFCEKKQSNDVWFLNSGCSNHMCGTKSLFKELDEYDKTDVNVGDNKKIQVEGRGTISIKTSLGNAKILQDVMFVPSLSHNLLSIRQLMISGYSILFKDGFCIIKDKKSMQITAN
ncbi:hypothetical protein K2173_009040 [Erythroxylum novogranatense]|uniref:Retrovirus-related Pol polyprotein from transposon TNT 1-94-like beta-barrel domain-containing protein n=1 Tax=Erythroxylum novogranatense TaxID=1862640 RepID=A0AAV8TUU0_9ROSI|nr:hypothetical protein K2173_009040 [Erythroxylum novogranatense]